MNILYKHKVLSVHRNNLIRKDSNLHMIISGQCIRKFHRRILLIFKRNINMALWKKKIWFIIINRIKAICDNLLSQFLSVIIKTFPDLSNSLKKKLKTKLYPNIRILIRLKIKCVFLKMKHRSLNSLRNKRRKAPLMS